MKRVIKLNEGDIERMVTKILKKTTMNEISVEPQFKKENLKPAKAMVDGVEKLVIVDGKGVVQAIGPDMSYLEGADKSEICRVADILIKSVFDLESVNDDQILGETYGLTDVEPINFCSKR